MALRGLLTARHRDTAKIRARIADHLEEFDGYVAFSGGKDSLIVLDLARQVDRNVPVAFFDSGLEYPENLVYIARLADRWNLNLHHIHAEPSALQVLQADGSWQHDVVPGEPRGVDLHTALIAEPARRAHLAWGDGELWGVRAQESQGRRWLYAAALGRAARAVPDSCGVRRPSELRGRFGGVVHRLDGTVAYGPIWDWRDDEVWGYIHNRELPVNPVYAKLRRLGAPDRLQRVSVALDANCLEFGRAVWLRRGWPELYAELVQALPRLAEWA